MVVSAGSSDDPRVVTERAGHRIQVGDVEGVASLPAADEDACVCNEGKMRWNEKSVEGSRKVSRMNDSVRQCYQFGPGRAWMAEATSGRFSCIMLAFQLHGNFAEHECLLTSHTSTI